MIEIGEPVQIHYYYKQKIGKEVREDKMKTDTVINITVNEISQADVDK